MYRRDCSACSRQHSPPVGRRCFRLSGNMAEAPVDANLISQASNSQNISESIIRDTIAQVEQPVSRCENPSEHTDRGT